MRERSRVDASRHGSVEPAGQVAKEVLKSETECWTCRRRRVQCDKYLPTCKKCHKAGKECLGYKKPLVWNKGVASRGKMMGKNYEALKKPQSEMADLKLYAPSEDTQGDCNVSPTSQTYPPFLIQGGALVDPIFQDFKPLTRYYLDYYTRKLSAEAVLYDLPCENPWRDLIVLIGTSPLLLKTILATAARDFTNFNSFSTGLSNGSLSGLTTNGKLESASGYHALWYKQIALAQLRKDLEQPSGHNNEVIVASISLFVFIELLESGRDTWRVHLDGVKRLVQLDEAASSQKVPTSDVVASSSGRNSSHFFDACITFDIMGTTLARPYRISKPMAPTADIYCSLQRSEKMSFIGCPADLLYLILVVNWQYWSKLQETAPTIDINSSTHILLDTDDSSIISNIQSFDPIQWARKTSLNSPHPDVPQRIHLATAYQSAVLIYAIRVLCPALPQSVPVGDHAAQVIEHLSTITLDDPFLKCIVWPTFIAGAETTDPLQQDAVRQLFHTFWLGYRSGNAINAVALLDQIWARGKELGAEGKVGGEDTGWCEYLAKGGADWLFL